MPASLTYNTNQITGPEQNDRTITWPKDNEELLIVIPETNEQTEKDKNYNKLQETSPCQPKKDKERRNV